MVLAMMLVSTVCYAATSYFAVSPAKSSGQVGINEKINYVVTTSSKTYGLKTVTVTIKDKSTGAVIGTPLTGTCKEEYTTKVTMKATMPSLAYANIVVTVNVTDKSNVSKDFTYNYTMDVTNKFTIDFFYFCDTITTLRSYQKSGLAHSFSCYFGGLFYG